MTNQNTHPNQKVQLIAERINAGLFQLYQTPVKSQLANFLHQLTEDIAQLTDVIYIHKGNPVRGHIITFCRHASCWFAYIAKIITGNQPIRLIKPRSKTIRQ